MIPEPLPTTVHDFLDLADRDLSQLRWLAFTGTSGSGKSTTAGWLLGSHPHWRGWSGDVVNGRPMDWSHVADLRDRVIAIDEIVDPADMRHVVGLLRRGNRLMIATHLAPIWWRCLAPWPGRCLRTDRHAMAKLRHALEQAGMHASDPVLEAYTQRYGSVYTALQIIIEACPHKNFDRSFRRFHRLHRITLGPEPGHR